MSNSLICYLGNKLYYYLRGLKLLYCTSLIPRPSITANTVELVSYAERRQVDICIGVLPGLPLC